MKRCNARSWKAFLTKQGYEVATAASGLEALARFKERPFQLVLLDYRMPDMNGDEVLRRMKAVNPLFGCIMITAFGSVQTAVEVMKLRSRGLHQKTGRPEKPLGENPTCRTAHACRHGRPERQSYGRTIRAPLSIVAEAPAMREVLSLVRRVAPTPWPVLIQGETGTGKEVVTRLIHLMSPRSSSPLVEVNCAALRREPLSKASCSATKKAPSPAPQPPSAAASRSRGRHDFLDEIGEISPNLQANLLRVLQEREFNRVGDTRANRVDVRVLTATNRDLEHHALQGSHCAKTSSYRLNVFTIAFAAAEGAASRTSRPWSSSLSNATARSRSPSTPMP